MTEMHWIILGVALLIGVIVAWWLFSRGSKTSKTRAHTPDVLDEGAVPARRNQALIDAPSAASQIMPPPAPIEPPRAAEAVAVAPKPVPEPVVAPVQVSEPTPVLVVEAAPEPAPSPASVAVEPVVKTPAVIAEPIAPAAPVIPAAAAPVGAGDDLRKIKGLGPKLVVLLQSLGVTSIAQIAAWDEADIDRIDAQLGTFAGRIRRDSWVEQAKLLSGDDTSAYEAKFGKV